jgi:mannose-6-phosphate isomerase-like protein (cupin superfamily)
MDGGFRRKTFERLPYRLGGADVDAATLAKMSPEEKEAFHREQESLVKTLKYERPAPSGGPKDFAALSKTRLGRLSVQIVHEGGENNLHYHNSSDTTWFVLEGRVKFYGPGDVLIADLGKHEGIAIPGGARYWFEKAGDVDLELLQCVSYDSAGGNAERINVEKHKDWMTSDNLLIYETSSAS